MTKKFLFLITYNFEVPNLPIPVPINMNCILLSPAKEEGTSNTTVKPSGCPVFVKSTVSAGLLADSRLS